MFRNRELSARAVDARPAVSVNLILYGSSCRNNLDRCPPPDRLYSLMYRLATRLQVDSRWNCSTTSYQSELRLCGFSGDSGITILKDLVLNMTQNLYLGLQNGGELSSVRNRRAPTERTTGRVQECHLPPCDSEFHVSST